MTIALVIIGIVVLGCFGGVLLFGAPYLPTLQPQVHHALELANLLPGQTLLELGCGDGRVLIAAAQVGIQSIGYELNPVLFITAWLRTRRYRKLARVVWGNFWVEDWPPADAIFTFLLHRYMAKLDDKIKHYNHLPIKLVSFAFPIPGREADHTKDGVYLYEYPI